MKGFISYYKSNGITTMKKHVEIEYKTFIKYIEEQTNMNVIQFAHEPNKK
jgi:hypothetical protein